MNSITHMDSVTYEELVAIQEELAAAREEIDRLRIYEEKYYDAERRYQWAKGVLSNKYMSKSDCTIAADIVENNPAVMKGEPVKLDVRNTARRTGYSDETVTKFLIAMKESEAFEYTYEHSTNHGYHGTESTIQANPSFLLAPNRINTKSTPTRTDNREKTAKRGKKTICPMCGNEHFKPQCQNCFTVSNTEDLLDIPEDEVPIIQERLEVARFIKTFCARPGCDIYINAANQIVIHVDDSPLNDREFDIAESFVKEHEICVRKKLETRTKKVSA